ncbi:hypothetical protein M413DRAFT_114492 [Hebeloma cylindrosporum]|uniref:Uncharacterized protein n=1 Tax=Hebeloma cylindrosporum TaxID=76867 RepID=A0A0C3D0T2_HEBCY|nr:hypothetical protein M413DRAFT_114492 [Hebeloma cylindrosporum h7]
MRPREFSVLRVGFITDLLEKGAFSWIIDPTVGEQCLCRSTSWTESSASEPQINSSSTLGEPYFGHWSRRSWADLFWCCFLRARDASCLLSFRSLSGCITVHHRPVSEGNSSISLSSESLFVGYSPSHEGCSGFLDHIILFKHSGTVFSGLIISIGMGDLRKDGKPLTHRSRVSLSIPP